MNYFNSKVVRTIYLRGGLIALGGIFGCDSPSGDIPVNQTQPVQQKSSNTENVDPMQEAMKKVEAKLAELSITGTSSDDKKLLAEIVNLGCDVAKFDTEAKINLITAQRGKLSSGDRIRFLAKDLNSSDSVFANENVPTEEELQALELLGSIDGVTKDGLAALVAALDGDKGVAFKNYNSEEISKKEAVFIEKTKIVDGDLFASFLELQAILAQEGVPTIEDLKAFKELKELKDIGYSSTIDRSVINAAKRLTELKMNVSIDNVDAVVKLFSIKNDFPAFIKDDVENARCMQASAINVTAKNLKVMDKLNKDFTQQESLEKLIFGVNLYDLQIDITQDNIEALELIEKLNIEKEIGTIDAEALKMVTEIKGLYCDHFAANESIYDEYNSFLLVHSVYMKNDKVIPFITKYSESLNIIAKPIVEEISKAKNIFISDGSAASLLKIFNVASVDEIKLEDGDVICNTKDPNEPSFAKITKGGILKDCVYSNIKKTHKSSDVSFLKESKVSDDDDGDYFSY